jgi:protoporphyrin/coproporphyrin ferrochelatase
MPKRLFSVDSDPPHDQTPAVGVLLVQLGTPDAPTPSALRRFLRQFLWDPRVIEMSRPAWWLILHLFVLPFRPKKSARLYENVWTEAGSPLLVTTRRLAAAVRERLAAASISPDGETPVHVALGMTYGRPSIAAALAELKAKGCRRLLVFPLYSHYSSSSTGAAFDAVMRELMTWRWVPEVRTIHQFHDDPGLIRALAEAVREHWAEHGQGEKLVMSFHGTPKRYLLDGDPYYCHCQKTSRLLGEELGLPRERYEVTFQSRFGREEWLQPTTDPTLKALAAAGVRSVDVICPGFRIDCLETLDEVDRESRRTFLEAGGETFRYVPCLNDRPQHVEVFVDLVRRNLAGWR